MTLKFVSCEESTVSPTRGYANLLLFEMLSTACVQCFDTVGRASERASGLSKLSDDVLAGLSICVEVEMICI